MNETSAPHPALKMQPASSSPFPFLSAPPPPPPPSLEPSGKGQIPFIGEETQQCPMSSWFHLISSDSSIRDTCAGRQSNCTLTSGPRNAILVTISMTTATGSQGCGFPLIGAGCRDWEEGLSEEWSSLIQLKAPSLNTTSLQKHTFLPSRGRFLMNTKKKETKSPWFLSRTLTYGEGKARTVWPRKYLEGDRQSTWPLLRGQA